jgi:arylsulfatase A-like enzyme
MTSNQHVERHTDRRIERSTPSAAPERVATLVIVGAWFGLLAGVTEVAALGVLKYALGRYLYRSPDAFWMIPVVDAVLTIAAVLVLAALARRWPRLGSLRSASLACSAIGFLTIAVLYVRLHGIAAVILAIGVGVQASRLIAHRRTAFVRLARLTVVPLASIVIISAALVTGVRLWNERRLMAALPPPTRNAPNVLLIVLDTVRAQSLSLYGYERPTTPALERLARSGTRFDRAVATSSWTLPSHASMFTGRYHHELSVNWTTPLDAAYPTFAEVLSRRGFATAGFVANTLYCGRQSGLSRGFVHYEDYGIVPGWFVNNSALLLRVFDQYWLREIIGNYELPGRKFAPAVNAAFLRWLSRKGDRPFFAFLNYFDAHEPYLPPAPYDTRFGPQRRRGNVWLPESWTPTPDEALAERDAYDGAIAYLDHHLGALFDELRQRGTLDDTIIIVTSDHGDEFAEHRLMSHGRSLYMPSLHVPLLIRYPASVPQGAAVPDWVTIADIPATVLDLLGSSGEEGLAGASLASKWDGSAGASRPALAELRKAWKMPEWFPVSKGDLYSLVAGDHHYIRNGDGREELYHITHDPDERHDLADTEEGRIVIERLGNRVDGLRSWADRLTRTR